MNLYTKIKKRLPKKSHLYDFHSNPIIKERYPSILAIKGLGTLSPVQIAYVLFTLSQWCSSKKERVLKSNTKKIETIIAQMVEYNCLQKNGLLPITEKNECIELNDLNINEFHQFVNSTFPKKFSIKQIFKLDHIWFQFN